jgi:hypothetical protein
MTKSTLKKYGFIKKKQFSSFLFCLRKDMLLLLAIISVTMSSLCCQPVSTHIIGRSMVNKWLWFFERKCPLVSLYSVLSFCKILCEVKYALWRKGLLQKSHMVSVFMLEMLFLPLANIQIKTGSFLGFLRCIFWLFLRCIILQWFCNKIGFQKRFSTLNILNIWSPFILKYSYIYL